MEYRKDQPGTPDQFSPEMVETYFLAATAGPEHFLRYAAYPMEIELPPVCHPKLNKIRQNWTAEEVLVIGADTKSRRLLLPISSIASNSHSVDRDLILLERDRLGRELGADSYLGLVHGHPRDPVKTNRKLMFNPNMPLEANFSCGDIFSQIYNGDLIKGVVEYNENLFSFASFETGKVAARFRKMTYRQFASHWASRNGFKFVPPNEEKEGETLIPLEKEASFTMLNRDMAKGLKLVLYRGAADGKLVREGV